MTGIVNLEIKITNILARFITIRDAILDSLDQWKSTRIDTGIIPIIELTCLTGFLTELNVIEC